MLFVKYALLFFALLNISTAIPINNEQGAPIDDSSSRPNNPKSKSWLNPAAAPFKPLQQQGSSRPNNPKSKSWLNPAATSFKPLQQQAQSGLLPGGVYLENIHRYDSIKMVPVIYLGPAIDDKGHLIPGKVDTVILVIVKIDPEKQPLIKTALGPNRPIADYFGKPVPDRIRGLRVDISHVQQVSMRLIDKKMWARTSDKGFEKLKLDTGEFRHGISHSPPGHGSE